jgi:hypothetical protein
MRFNYYPKTNVYYDLTNKEYIYNTEGKWVKSPEVPQGYEISNSSRVVMYSMKPDIWAMNDLHVAQYQKQGNKPKKFMGISFGNGKSHKSESEQVQTEKVATLTP